MTRHSPRLDGSDDGTPFYLDPDMGQPHIFGHGITEDEVRELFRGPGEDRAARNGSRLKLGQTFAVRDLQVGYAPDENEDGAFVITAYELLGKAKTAFRRRPRWRRR